jgi:hypothetical protein
MRGSVREWMIVGRKMWKETGLFKLVILYFFYNEIALEW